MESMEIRYFMDKISEEFKTDVQIIAGDFNAKPKENLVLEMKEEYQSAYELAKGYEPKTAIYGSIDYIFFKGAAKLVSVLDIDFQMGFHDYPSLTYPSDHL